MCTNELACDKSRSTKGIGLAKREYEDWTSAISGGNAWVRVGEAGAIDAISIVAIATIGGSR